MQEKLHLVALSYIIDEKRKAVLYMAPITREQALENALASSRIEGYEVTEQTRADCRRLMDGKVDARTLAAEILARRRG